MDLQQMPGTTPLCAGRVPEVQTQTSDGDDEPRCKFCGLALHRIDKKTGEKRFDCGTRDLGGPVILRSDSCRIRELEALLRRVLNDGLFDTDEPLIMEIETALTKSLPVD